MVVVMLVFVMLMAVIVRMFVVRLRREVDVKFHANDGGFLLARDVEVIAVELELFQFAFQFARVHAEVEQGGDEHVASDAAEEVEIKDFHCRRETSNIQQPTSNIEWLRRNNHWLFGIRCWMLDVFW
jgi:hypothetical protein